MKRIHPSHSWPLFDVAAIRRMESAAAAALPPHTLMQRAGRATARLAMAIAPHARNIWVACGPGNNGGDGLEAAMQLKRLDKDVVVTWLGDEGGAPADSLASLRRARDAGVTLASIPPAHCDLAIDALLGIGASRALDGTMAEWARRLSALDVPVLAVDIPSGLDAGTGAGRAVRATHTLSLLALKPGLFTAGGRDACGEVWLDDLEAPCNESPQAWLGSSAPTRRRPHDSHKGSYGDVAVIGGAPGMAGAAVLAASGALHGGAGRVFVGLLDAGALALDPSQPELMLRPWESLDLAALAVACGCGGGDAVRPILHKVISTARSLVLDADALNAIACDGQLLSLLQARSRREGRATVLTPHPLEAARLLGTTAAMVQADRLAAAQDLAARSGCVVLLKGSGSIIAAPGHTPVINATGNALLATAGTGDVLAGLVAACLAAGTPAFDAATHAAHRHGLAADNWPQGQALTAGALAHRL